MAPLRLAMLGFGGKIRPGDCPFGHGADACR